MKLIFLQPVMKHNIWGGTNLRTEYGYQVEGDDIGECWGIAAHKNGDCTIREGEFKGQTLSGLWKNEPQLFGKKKEETENCVFPLLIKIIDAKEDLSIQVHPDDEYADVHENHSLGKTECWYILSSRQDAELVVGHNAKDKAELESMIREGRWNEFIRKVKVKPGDFIQIDPGTVHAIKGGITLLETQQNSDITYRVYDYDRLQDGKPRELHIDKSIDVITVPAKDVSDSVISMEGSKENRLNEMYACKYYRVFYSKVSGKMTCTRPGAYLLVSVVEGSGEVCGHEVKKGDHFIVPNSVDEICFEGNMEVIASTEYFSE